MQRLLFDLDAMGLAAAGLIALLARWKPSTWWLALQAPLGLALVGVGLVVVARMVPELASNDDKGAVLLGIKMTLAVASIALGALFVVQLIARIGKRETVAVIALMIAPYQVTLGIVALVAPIAYWLYRMHWLDWLQL
jgi:hypothetical protein